MEYHPSQVSRVGWYIASYIERIDPLSAYEDENLSHEPWAVWENRILVKAYTPHEALERTKSHLENVRSDFMNTDGVMVRSCVVGLTGLIAIYDPLEDGEEIEWIDHTGETVADMLDRIVVEDQLEAFTIPKNAQEPEQGVDCKLPEAPQPPC
jgi:hypothetical protein